MKFTSMAFNQLYVLRVDPGEGVLGSIRHFLEAADVRQAVVLGGYGIEILSMNGLVVDGDPHIHVTLSAPL